MEQRLSLVTLGVSDVGRAKAFYEALGWEGRQPAGDVVFFQAGGMVVALWSREQLAEDSTVEDSGGWGGVTLAHNVRSPEEVDSVLAEAERAGAMIGRAGAPTFCLRRLTSRSFISSSSSGRLRRPFSGWITNG